MTAEAALNFLRLALGLVVAGYSLELVVTQLQGMAHHALVLLGLAELVGAILFLITTTVRAGGIAPIVVFAIAGLFHVLHREYGIGYLAVYAAAAFAVVSSWRRV